MPNISGMSDQDLDKKIQELTQKYFQAMRLSPSIVSQMVLLLDSYKEEQQNRAIEKAKKAAENGDDNINELIKIN